MANSLNFLKKSAVLAAWKLLTVLIIKLISTSLLKLKFSVIIAGLSAVDKISFQQ